MRRVHLETSVSFPPSIGVEGRLQRESDFGRMILAFARMTVLGPTFPVLIGIGILVFGVGTPEAFAKTVRLPRGNAQVDQLHDELLSAFPAWKGTRQPDGSYEGPLLSVESTPAEILLTVPEEASESAVRQRVAAHVPKKRLDASQARQTAQEKLKALGFTDAEIAQILR